MARWVSVARETRAPYAPIHPMPYHEVRSRWAEGLAARTSLKEKYQHASSYHPTEYELTELRVGLDAAPPGVRRSYDHSCKIQVRLRGKHVHRHLQAQQQLEVRGDVLRREDRASPFGLRCSVVASTTLAEALKNAGSVAGEVVGKDLAAEIDKRRHDRQAALKRPPARVPLGPRPQTSLVKPPEHPPHVGDIIVWDAEVAEHSAG